MMRDQPQALRQWVRGNLSKQFGGVVTEAIPQEMLELLASLHKQD